MSELAIQAVSDKDRVLLSHIARFSGVVETPLLLEALDLVIGFIVALPQLDTVEVLHQAHLLHLPFDLLDDLERVSSPLLSLVAAVLLLLSTGAWPTSVILLRRPLAPIIATASQVFLLRGRVHGAKRLVERGRDLALIAPREARCWQCASRARGRVRKTTIEILEPLWLLRPLEIRTLRHTLLSPTARLIDSAFGTARENR